MVDEIQTMQQKIERLQLLKNHKLKRMWLVIEEDLHYYGEMDIDMKRGSAVLTGKPQRKKQYNRPHERRILWYRITILAY